MHANIAGMGRWPVSGEEESGLRASTRTREASLWNGDKPNII